MFDRASQHKKAEGQRPEHDAPMVGKSTLVEQEAEAETGTGSSDADADADAGDGGRGAEEAEADGGWTPQWEDIPAEEVADAHAALAEAADTDGTASRELAPASAQTARASAPAPRAKSAASGEVDRKGKPIKRRNIAFGRAQLKYRGRGWAKVVRETTVLSSDGTQRTLHKGERFHFGGVDAKGYCVLYNDKESKNAPTPAHPNGSTFFGVAHKKYLRLIGKDDRLHKIRTQAGKDANGKPHGRSRQRGAIGFDKKMASQPRRITARPLPPELVHGPGAPMYEYTHVGGGNYVSGAETPASLHRGGEKLGTGYTTGMFRDGATFHDIGGNPVTTPIRDINTNQPGTAHWVFGWVIERKAKIWTWMLDHISIGDKRYQGNVG